MEVDRNTETLSILTKARIKVNSHALSTIPHSINIIVNSINVPIQLIPLFTVEDDPIEVRIKKPIGAMSNQNQAPQPWLNKKCLRPKTTSKHQLRIPKKVIWASKPIPSASNRSKASNLPKPKQSDCQEVNNRKQQTLDAAQRSLAGTEPYTFSKSENFQPPTPPDNCSGYSSPSSLSTASGSKWPPISSPKSSPLLIDFTSPPPLVRKPVSLCLSSVFAGANSDQPLAMVESSPPTLSPVTELGESSLSAVARAINIVTNLSDDISELPIRTSMQERNCSFKT